MTDNISETSGHEFVLVLDGLSEITTELEDRLYEAGCDDATLSFQGGCGYLQFTRVAASYKAAVESAIRDAQSAGVVVSRVEVCA